MFTFSFNKATSMYHYDAIQINEQYIQCSLNHLKYVYIRRGWLYLREVLDFLGLEANHIDPCLGWCKHLPFEWELEHDSEPEGKDVIVRLNPRNMMT